MRVGSSVLIVPSRIKINAGSQAHFQRTAGMERQRCPSRVTPRHPIGFLHSYTGTATTCTLILLVYVIARFAYMADLTIILLLEKGSQIITHGPWRTQSTFHTIIILEKFKHHLVVHELLKFCTVTLIRNTSDKP